MGARVSNLVAVAAGLGAAASFAASTVLQARSASSAPDAQGLRPRQLAAFLAATLTHPLYLAGLVADVAGVGLHALALHAGALAFVQPLLVTGVLFTLPLHHHLAGRRVSRGELVWGVVLTAALAGFLLTASTDAGTGTAGVAEPVDRGPAVAAAVLAAAAALACTLLARRAGAGSPAIRGAGTSPRPGTAAALLGVATGIAFAGTAALLKTCTDLLVRGPLALLTGWQLYALLGVGAAGLLLHQLAFQAGPLTASLPAFTAVDPLVSVALGVVIFDERLRHTPSALLLELVSLALLSVAAVILTRTTLPGPDQSGTAPPGLAAGTSRR